MTFPVDDNGNVRVDFVWGNLPLQPDQERTDQVTAASSQWNQPEDRGWSAPSYAKTSDTLPTTVYQFLTLGDQSYDDFYQSPDTREVTVPTIHNIATTGYNNFPEFLPNYAGDGDPGLEAVVPNIVGLTYPAAGPIITAAGFVDSGSTTTWVGATVANDGLIKTQYPAAGSIANVGLAISIIRYNAPEVPNLVGLTEADATTALTNVHLVKGAVTTADNAAGATAINDGEIKTQSIAAGTTVDTGSSVALVKYAYVGVSTTGPIAGFNRSSTNWSLNGNEVVMYVIGRTVKPTVGATITVSGTSASDWNQNWTVEDVVNDDSYNTGGTAVKLAYVDHTFTDGTSSGGTWTAI